MAKKQPPVRIHEPERVELAKLKFAPYNPKIMPVEEYEALKASLRKHGAVLTLVVQRRSEEHGKLVIVDGHDRVRAVRDICEEAGQPPPEHAWAIVLDVDDATAKQLNVTLRNVGGEFDHHKLGELLASVRDAPGFDLEAIGFGAEQVEELVRNATASPEELAAALEESVTDLGGFGRSITLTVEFDTVERRDEAKALLKAIAGDKKAGVALVEALKAARAA